MAIKIGGDDLASLLLISARNTRTKVMLVLHDPSIPHSLYSYAVHDNCMMLGVCARSGGDVNMFIENITIISRARVNKTRALVNGRVCT